jgi:hypothetical protein
MKVFLAYVKKIIPKKIFKKLQPAYHYFLSFLSALVYCHPSDKLIVIGGVDYKIFLKFLYRVFGLKIQISIVAQK